MESNVSRTRRSMRSVSATTTRRSSSRSDSSSPFRRAGAGLLSVLRQKFSIRIARGDGESSRYHGDDPDSAIAAGTSATLSSSWRSRPRHEDKPIRPAYSDECLSCCGRSTCLRSRTHRHQHNQVSQEMMRFHQPSHRPAAAVPVPSTSQKVIGIVICKHCHAKNDRSPSDFEMSQDVSQSEDEKVASPVFSLFCILTLWVIFLAACVWDFVYNVTVFINLLWFLTTFVCEKHYGMTVATVAADIM